MKYIRVRFSNGIDAYQEVLNGQVVRYASLSGVTVRPRAGLGSSVTDANPPRPSWGLPDPVQVIVRNTVRTRAQFINMLRPSEVGSLLSSADWTFDNAGSVDLSAPEVATWLNKMEALGVIAVGRAAAILNA